MWKIENQAENKDRMKHNVSWYEYATLAPLCRPVGDSNDKQENAAVLF